MNFFEPRRGLVVNRFSMTEAVQAAKNAKAFVEEARKQKVAALLEKHRYYRKFLLFGPRVRRTDEQARMFCDHWTMMWTENKYFETYDDAEYVLHVAEHSLDDHIWLTRDEYYHLVTYWPNNWPEAVS